MFTSSTIQKFSFFLILLMSLDVVSTEYAISQGHHEQNPFMAHIVDSAILFILLKLIVSIVVIYIMKTVIKMDKNKAIIGMRLIIGLMLFVVLGNGLTIIGSANYWSSSTIANGYFYTDVKASQAESTPNTFYIGSNLYMLSGYVYGGVIGFSWNGTGWEVNSSVKAGLPDIDTGGNTYESAPCVFYIGSDLFLIIGVRDNVFYEGYPENGLSGWKWNIGTAQWDRYDTIISGLYPGLNSIFSSSNQEYKPSFFNNGNYNLIWGVDIGTFGGFTWNGTTWNINASLINGLSDVGFRSAPTIYYDHTWRLISGSTSGTWYGFDLLDNGTWASNSTIVTGIVTGSGSFNVPHVFQKDNVSRFLTGLYDSRFLYNYGYDNIVFIPTNKFEGYVSTSINNGNINVSIWNNSVFISTLTDQNGYWNLNGTLSIGNYNYSISGEWNAPIYGQDNFSSSGNTFFNKTLSLNYTYISPYDFNWTSYSENDPMNILSFDGSAGHHRIGTDWVTICPQCFSNSTPPYSGIRWNFSGGTITSGITATLSTTVYLHEPRTLTTSAWVQGEHNAFIEKDDDTSISIDNNTCDFNNPPGYRLTDDGYDHIALCTNSMSTGNHDISMSFIIGRPGMLNSYSYPNLNTLVYIYDYSVSPIISFWSNSITNNNDLGITEKIGNINFIVDTDQPINTWNWYVDGAIQSNNINTFTYNNLNFSYHTISVNGTNSRGITNTLSWILSPEFDPSGYVKGLNGIGLDRSQMTLSNSTYTNTVFTDPTGLYNQTIYQNGTYNYNVSKDGYTTISGSQVFTIGGINSNYTLTPNGGLLYGTVYEWNYAPHTVAVSGKLNGAKVVNDNSGNLFKIFLGGTLDTSRFFPMPDNASYVIKNKDIDISGNSARIQLFDDNGNIVLDDFYNIGDKIHFLSSSNSGVDTYFNVDIVQIFSSTGGEIQFITVKLSSEYQNKCGVLCWATSYLSFIVDLLDRGVFGGLGGLTSHLFIGLENWIYQGQGTGAVNSVYVNVSTDPVIFNEIYDLSNVNATTIYYTVQIPSSGSNKYPFSIEYGFTDNLDQSGNDWGLEPNFKVISISGEGITRGIDIPFSSIDRNGDGIIKAWTKFQDVHSFFNHYVSAYCNDCNLKPLPGALVYLSQAYNTLTLQDGSYSLAIPLLANENISYSKEGYEIKYLVHSFNTSSSTYNQDMTINRSNITIIPNTYALSIVPDPSLINSPPSAYYSTTDQYLSYLICVYPFGVSQSSDCYNSDGVTTFVSSGIPSNTNDFVPFRQYPIGTYTATIEGSNLGFSYDVVFSTNFTVIGINPTVAWQASKYYMNDSMILNVFVPSGSQNFTIYYPNGTIYQTMSQSTTVSPIQTILYTNTGSFPAGTYRATITSGNTDTTVLSSDCNTCYSLSAPASVEWGNIFKIKYTSPKTTLLTISDSNGEALITPRTVSGIDALSINSSLFQNKDQVIRIALIDNNQAEKANTTTQITPVDSGPAGTGTNTMDNLLFFLSLPAFWGILIFVICVIVTAWKAPSAVGIVAFIIPNLEAIIGLWSPYTIYVFIVTWIIASIFFTIGRDTTTGGNK